MKQEILTPEMTKISKSNMERFSAHHIQETDGTKKKHS